jgi:hypothetical protein
MNMRTLTFRVLGGMALLCPLLTTPARALNIAPLWGASYGDASSQFAYDVAIDNVTGRIAITGAFQGTINFGGGIMTSQGNNDVFLATFEPDGTFIAERLFGDATAQSGVAVEWLADGTLMTTGNFAGTINLGGAGTFTSSGSNDIYLARYDYRLTYMNSKKFGDASIQTVTDLAVDNASNVIMVGYYQGTVNFGGSNLTTAGASDMFVAKFNSGLTHTWSKSFGDAAGSQFASGVDTDVAGNVYLCGYYTGTINLGGSTFTSAGVNDIVIAKLSSAGVHQWSKSFGDASNQVASQIAANSGGEVYVTGSMVGTVNFGGSALTSAGLEDVFLAKFSTLGSHLWSNRFGDATSQFGISVDCDDSAVYIGGQAMGTTSFGLGNLIAVGGRDAFFAKFSAAGAVVWNRIYGDASDQYGYAVDVGGGRVAFTGYFQGVMDFGFGALTAAGYDPFLFVAAANAREPVIQSMRDVPNDQGRKLRVRFQRSGNDDAISTDPIVRYEAYIEDMTNPMAGIMRDAAGGGPRVYVGSIPAHAEPGYEMIVPTFVDSTIAMGDYDSRVYIYAARESPIGVFIAGPGIGSSIDNLAPGMSALRLDDHLLEWNASTAPDVNYYSIYGASNASFGSSTLIDYTIDTNIDLTASPRAYYFVTATDFSGNEGAPVMVRVLTGTEGMPTSRVLSLSAYPNPFNPATTLRYTLPSAGRVMIDVYDARGTRIARLADVEKAAGAYTTAWRGVDQHGASVGSGIYFARISHAGAVRTYKLVLVK